MKKEARRILIVEDEGIVAEDIGASLRNMGYEVCGMVPTGEDAVRFALENRPDLVLMDIMLAGAMNGIEAATQLQDTLDVPVIFLSAFSDEELLLKARETGSFGYLMKPFRDKELQASVEFTLTRHAMASELRAARDEWERTFDAVPDLMAVVGTDLKISRCNRALAEKVGRPKDEVTGQYCYRIFHNADAPKPLCPFSLMLQDGREHVDELHEEHLKGDFLFTVTPLRDASGTIYGGLHVARDITPLKKVEEQQRRIDEQTYRAQKEKSLITIAGGIAHEFNNILTVVMGNAELLRMRVGHDDRLQELAQDIESAGVRMATLTERLLAYAKGGKYLPQRLLLNTHINQSIQSTLRGASVSGILVSTSLDDSLWPIVADPDQMNQVITNILSNAVEAMGGGGTLTVNTQNLRREAAWECTLGTVHPPGEYVLLSVSDTGHGIPANRVKDVFEPFFSTKFKGRGLGLSAVLGIVTNHGGCVDLKSEPGRGTTVRVMLPRATGREEETRFQKGDRPEVGKGTILVVDDEPRIRVLLEKLLAREGFDVCMAEGGMEAGRIFGERFEEFSLVILDVMMPDIRGTEVFRTMKRIRPSVPILVSSGFDREMALSNIKLGGGDEFLQKPYSGKALMEVVHAMTGTA